jgi:asparagine synthase (glutamine-hydrolysing)
MTRFCAAIAADAAREVAAMGATLAMPEPHCALGLLPNERPGAEAGPFRAAGLSAVGEVTLFNRDALLADLARDGEAPLPDCADGELLLHCFARRGPHGLAAADGMFALAIRAGETLVLVRDQLGARPLFFARAGDAWVAGSSLRALRRWPRLGARLNLNALRAFLSFAYLPGDETLIDGVFELLPGRCLRLHLDGTLEETHYWEPRERPWNDAEPPEAHAARLRVLLEQAVAARLPPGREVGIFLSGGIDSSLVTALAARLHDRPVRTYAINFGADLPNELAYSGLVAAHCRTKHTVLTFDGRETAERLAETVALLDCPVGDPLTVPNLLLARRAAQDGLDVILNGEGGDPVFGGPKNLPMLLFELHRDDPDPAARARAYLHTYQKCYADLERLLRPEVLDALRDAPPLERHIQPLLHAEQMQSYLNRLLYTNVRTKGAHHILPKVERLTAACGIEGRSPLFAPALVDAAFAVPPHLKLTGVQEKWALKLAVRDLLPPTIISRPKSGMLMPVRHWARDQRNAPLRDLSHQLLLGCDARTRDLFQPDTVRAWARGEGMLWPRYGQVLWLLLTLELWLRSFELSE